jgi:hypothetical protein
VYTEADFAHLDPEKDGIDEETIEEVKRELIGQPLPPPDRTEEWMKESGYTGLEDWGKVCVNMYILYL